MQNGSLTNKIDLYSIDYPPLPFQSTDSEDEGRFRSAQLKNKYLPAVGTVLIIACLIIIAIYMIRKNRQRRSVPTIALKLAGSLTDDERQVPGIHVFGGFYIYDTGGNELTAPMAPKTRQLLLYFLVNAFILGDKNSRGVTTEQLTRNLWPDLNQENAKNARGTSMNRLRETLAKIPFLDIIFQGNKWAIHISDRVYYDYCAYQILFSELKYQHDVVCNNKFQQLLNLTQNGPLLPNHNYDWLFPLQSAINNEIVEYYLNLLTKLDMSENIKLCEQIADTILKWETLNEEALAYKINLLNLQKRHDQAKNVYTKFVRDYKEMFGEKYTKQLNHIIFSQKF
jgi:two-component SAPR family response regulator